jgi:hypothetical protein
MRSIIRASLLMAVLAGAGCAATVATGPAPDLVYVSPGVQVIADYGEPIFYSGGFYWRYYGGGWYRSSYYTGGWVYARPPVAVLRIDRPYSYRYYRPQGWAGHPRTGPAPGGWRGHPQTAPAPGGWRAGPQAAPAPGGWRGGGPQAAPAPGGWRGGGPPPAAARRPAAPPAPPRGAPPPGRGGGWRGHQ